MLAPLDQAGPIVADEAEAAIAKLAVASLAPAARRLVDAARAAQRGPPAPGSRGRGRAHRTQCHGRAAVDFGHPNEAELTTQQAADYLNVSQPFLISLIDRGENPHRMAGRHRRVRFADLLAFERSSAEQRKQVPTEMAAEARRLGLD